MIEAWVVSFAELVQALQLRQIENGCYESPFDPGEPVYNKRRLSITPQEGMILAALAEGKTVLEIGSGLGVSTHYLASRAQHVTTIDIDPWVQSNVWPVLERLPNVQCFTDVPQGLTVDLCFIDGCHVPPFVLADIVRGRHVVVNGGALVFHDTAIAAVRDTIEREGYLFEANYATSCGVGVVRLWNT
jgi:hypothetical protein